MQLKEQLIAGFDPNSPGVSGHLFGLPFPESCSEMIIVPVPWEVTVSSRDGTALAPKAIHKASLQVDLFIDAIPDAWKLGFSMLPIEETWVEKGRKMRLLATEHIRSIEVGGMGDQVALASINKACEKLVEHVKNTTGSYLKQHKLVSVLGGDHSVSLGFMQALGEQYNRFGILQIDAHADLREAYEGFVYSHASIMHNAMKLSSVERLVQVGLRDYCQEEHEAIKRSEGKIIVFYDQALKRAQYSGETWSSQCDSIVKCLPQNVYISFDIDGMDPKLCPHTGTPVPGGFEFYQIILLIEHIVRSGRKIIGFDLSEVAPVKNDHWDACVGARLLYLLCSWMAVSQNRLHYKC